MKNLFKQVWNSEAFIGASEVNYEVLKAIGKAAKLVCEATLEVFQQGVSSSTETKESTSTYDYWMSLSYQEQEDYFNSNEYLRDYIKNDYYSGDRHLTAKHVQHIADKMNKEFTNKYNRY